MSQSSPSAARRSKLPSRAPTDPSLSSPQGASSAPLGPISRISKVSVRPLRQPSIFVRSSDRWDDVGVGAEHRELPPARCRYISLSPPSEESSNYSVGPNGRRSQPARRLAPTNERANPALYSLPFLSVFHLQLPLPASLARYPRTNERTRTSKSWGSLSKPQRASSSL